MTFEPHSVVLNGQIKLTAPIDQVFPLFSPLGERIWVPGWNPELLYPRNVEWAEGQLFRTQEERGDAIWVISRLDMKNFHVVYHRIEPDRYIARIEICCRQASANITQVKVIYTFAGLSENGNQEIDIMSQSAYDEKMKRWALWLSEHLKNSQSF